MSYHLPRGRPRAPPWAARCGLLSPVHLSSSLSLICVHLDTVKLIDLIVSCLEVRTCRNIAVAARARRRPRPHRRQLPLRLLRFNRVAEQVRGELLGLSVPSVLPIPILHGRRKIRRATMTAMVASELKPNPNPLNQYHR